MVSLIGSNSQTGETCFLESSSGTRSAELPIPGGEGPHDTHGRQAAEKAWDSPKTGSKCLACHSQNNAWISTPYIRDFLPKTPVSKLVAPQSGYKIIGKVHQVENPGFKVPKILKPGSDNLCVQCHIMPSGYITETLSPYATGRDLVRKKSLAEYRFEVSDYLRKLVALKKEEKLDVPFVEGVQTFAKADLAPERKKAADDFIERLFKPQMDANHWLIEYPHRFWMPTHHGETSRSDWEAAYNDSLDELLKLNAKAAEGGAPLLTPCEEPSSEGLKVSKFKTEKYKEPNPSFLPDVATFTDIPAVDTMAMEFSYPSSSGGVKERDDVRFRVEVTGSDGSVCLLDDVAPTRKGSKQWKIRYPVTPGVTYKASLQVKKYCFDATNAIKLSAQYAVEEPTPDIRKDRKKDSKSH